MSCYSGSLIFVALATLFLPASAGWWSSFSEEVPANCPYQNNETHVCTTLDTYEGVCITVDCCENFEDDEDVEDYYGNYYGDYYEDYYGDHYEDDSDESATGSNHGGWGSHGDSSSGEVCSLCALRRACTLYTCYSSCCDGFEMDHFTGKCTNETGGIECQNGGEPRSWWGWEYCDCPRGFRGHYCEIPKCRCKNDGDCVVQDGEPHCNCKEGYYGDRCEKSNCTMECYNGGECYMSEGKEFCWCPDDFIGTQCERYYANPDTCPVPEHTSDMCECECTSNSDCEEDHVCCKEGCSSVCREPKADYCLHEGRRYDINSTNSPDPCTTCFCSETGEMSCATVSCAQPVCSYGEATVVPGQCCPSCPEKPDPPKIKNCPTSVLYVETRRTSDQAWLNETETKIEAYDSEGNTLVVKYRPEKVHHCHCSSTLGTQTRVQAYVTDMYDSFATCSFNISVKDVFPPTFKYCPNDITVSEKEVAQWAEPVYQDNVGIATVSVPESQSGDVLPVGQHTMTYTVKDHDGNVASCSFTVTITRESPRMDNCPSDMLYLDTTYYTDHAVLNEMSTGILSHDSEGNKLQVYYEPQTVQHCKCQNSLTKETTVKAMAADDCGKNSSCTFQVTVKDIYRPTFTYCPEDREAIEDEAVKWTEPKYSDNVGIDKVEADMRNGDVFSVGNHTVTYIIWDYDGNMASCQFNVYVASKQPEPPKIQNCPHGVLIVNTSYYNDHAYLDDRKTGIKAFDAVGNPLQVMYQPEKVEHCYCQNPSSNTVDVTARVYDSNGNSDTCQFKVTVKDIYKPVFSYCPGNMYVSENEKVSWQEPTHTDNVAVAQNTFYSPFNNGQVFPVGNHTVYYKIWDYDSNYAMCMFNVSVTKEQTKPPKFHNCPTKVFHLNTPSNSDQAVISEETTAIQAFDHEGNKMQVTFTPAVVPHCHCYDGHSAETTVYASVTDENAITEMCIFNVTVIDAYRPVIYNCPQNIQANEGDKIEWTKPTFQDNVGIAGNYVNRNSGEIFSVGRHTVTYMVWDYDLNNASCSFDVTVTKRVPPKIHNCSNNPNNVLILYTPSTSDTVDVNENTTSITASDAEGHKLKVDFRPTSVRHCHCYNSVSTKSEIKATAQDHYGNVVTCSFTVVVIDQVKPVVTYCPPSMSVSEGVVVTWRTIEFFDNVAVPRKSATGRNPGTTFPVGVHGIMYELWDYDGKRATCQFNVTVNKAKCTLECYNGGRCYRNGNNQFCRCPHNFVGKQCGEKYIHTHCQHEGRQYSVNATYSPEPCTTCTCVDTGEMICASVQCSIPQCPGGRQPVSKPDRCCLECPEEPKPRIKCPYHTVHLNTSDYENKAVLGQSATSVEAYDAYNQQLLVHYRPPTVDHCKCRNPLARETTVQAYATDGNGNVATCSFKVVVRDIYPPKIYSCPENIYVVGKQRVKWMEPNAVDNVGVVAKSCIGKKNGTVLDVGEHSISCIVWDFDRNTAVCHFRVSVIREDTSFDEMPVGHKARHQEKKGKLEIILPPIFGVILLIVLALLLFYFCRRKCEPSVLLTKSPKHAKPDDIYAKPDDNDSEVPTKSRRPSVSSYSSASSKTVSSRVLGFHSNVYSVPGDMDNRPPPYSPPLYGPPPYSFSGSVRDVSYVSLPLPSYTNPEYETLGVHRSNLYSPSVMSRSTVASRAGSARSTGSPRRSTAGSVKSTKSSKSSFRA